MNNKSQRTSDRNPSDRYLVVIGTPLQLLNALEYIHTINLAPDKIDLLDVSFSRETRNIIDRTLTELRPDIQNRYRLPHTTSKRKLHDLLLAISNRVSTWKLGIDPPRKYGEIIIGHYALPIFRHFASKANRLTVVDDGTFSIHCSEGRKAELTQGKPFIILKSTQNRLNHLLWPSKGIPKSVHWFTRYDLTFPKEDKVTRNTFSHIQSLNSPKPREPTLLFIGMNLVDCDIISKEHYTKYIRAVASHFHGLKMTYVAKYSESGSVIKEIGSVLRELGGEVLLPKTNLEVHLLNCKTAPTMVASFYTSAFINAMDILGDKTSFACVQLDTKLMPARFHDSISQCYDLIYNHPIFNRSGLVLPANIASL